MSRTPPLPEDAPTRGEADRDLAVDRGLADPYQWPAHDCGQDPCSCDPWAQLPAKGEN